MFPLAVLAVALLQSDVTHLRVTSSPTSGVLSVISEDGDRLYHARGARVVEIDLALVRKWELDGADDPDVERATRRVIPLEASITSMLSVGPDLFVGGGDTGLFCVGPAAAQDTSSPVRAIDTDTGGRWCFDLALDRERNELLALWGARDGTQLRSYDLETFEPRLVVDVNQAAGVERPGTGYALALFGDYAYLALGVSGIARVALGGREGVRGAVEQGPSFVPQAARTDREIAPYRVRDLTIADGHLYAAADASGLFELELTSLAAWNAQTRGVLHRFVGHYPVRVETIRDDDATLVVVGTAPAPSAAHEWGPYYQYSTFDWRLTPPGVDPESYTTGCGTALFVFERRAGGPLVQALWMPIEGAHGQRSWKSLATQQADGCFWAFDNEFTVWSFERDATTGRLTRLEQLRNRRYALADVSYASGIRGALDPNLLFTGEDDAARMPFYRVEGTNAQPELVPLAGSDHKRFNLGLMMNGQWVSRLTGREWLAFGMGSSFWRLVELTTSRARPERLLSAGPGEWKSRYLEFPVDPQFGQVVGRSYGSVAVDYRESSELVAMSRTHAPTPVTLFSRDEIERYALASGGRRSGKNNPVEVKPIGHLTLHPELGDPVPREFLTDLFSLNMHFFPWHDGQRERAVLGVATGATPGAGEFATHPKLAFVYLDDCTDRSSSCAALYSGPNTGVNPAILTIARGSRAEGMLWDFDVATVAGTQYAFACDTSGAVLAFDLTSLFSGLPLTEAARWDMPVSQLDGRCSPMTAIRVRAELPPGEATLATYLYIAANRRGIVKLRARPSEAGGLWLEHELTINTPSQASGLIVGEFDLGEPEPLEALIVFDHEDGGIKLYTGPPVGAVEHPTPVSADSR